MVYFPSFRSVNDIHALEEERRLMYVAMTRAKKELYISRAKERFHFWDYVRNPESRFMKEIPAKVIENYDLADSSIWGKWFFNSVWARDSWSDFSFWDSGISKPVIKAKANNDISQFNMWDKITHPKFWNGIITSLKWELAEIAFTGKGVKKMNIKIAPIRKI